MTHYQIHQIDDGRSHISFKGVPYGEIDRTGHWSIWSVCKMFEAARLLSFYHGYIDFPRMDSADAGFFIVKHVFKLAPELHKKMSLFTSADLHFNLNILDIGNTSVMMSSKLTNGENGSVLGENIFKYIYVDRKTRRSKKLPEWWLEKYGTYKKQDIVTGMAKTELPVPPNDAFRYKFKARHSDTDKNGHVNNTVYIKLCIDCGTVAAKNGRYQRFDSDLCFYSVLSIDALYIGESNVNDELEVCTWPDAADDRVLHFIVYNNYKQVFYANVLFGPEKALRPKPEKESSNKPKL